MYYTKEQPTTGSFVMVWAYNGDMYSSNYKYVNTELYKFNDYKDKFEFVPHAECLAEDCTDIMYLVQSPIKYTEMK